MYVYTYIYIYIMIIIVGLIMMNPSGTLKHRSTAVSGPARTSFGQLLYIYIYMCIYIYI